MYIKMSDDKSLVITINTPIYRGEANADMITFFLPVNYEGLAVGNCSVLLRYLNPLNEGCSESLQLKEELYKGYLQYTTTVDTMISGVEGEVVLWLVILGGDNQIAMKTGEAVIDVLPSRDVTENMPSSKIDRLDELELAIEHLERTKADNIVFNSDDSTIQLVANGTTIGDRIAVSTAIDGVYVTAVTLNENDEIVVSMSDGTEEVLGALSSGSIVYVPHIDDQKILTFTIEEAAGEIPDPVDLNAFDEWSEIEDSETTTEYVWEDM